MATETGGAAFARDLGYLDKFFANLTAHADTLPAAQGERLKQLMAEEVVRWKEIRQLIAGQGGAPAAAAPKPAAPAAPPAPAPSPSAAPLANAPQGKAPVKLSLTVGSLLGQPKK
jgi:hypothetical protein